MKLRGKDPKIWITADNFLSSLLYSLAKCRAYLHYEKSLRKSRSEQQEIQLFTGLINGLGQCLTSADYRWCNEIFLSVNQLYFLACCKESAGPWLYHFLHSFFPGRRWSQPVALPRPCSKSRGLLLHPSALCIASLFDLMNQCTCLSTSNTGKVAS